MTDATICHLSPRSIIIDIMRTIVLLALFLAPAAVRSAAGENEMSLSAKVEKLLPKHVGACVLALDHGKIVFEHAYGVTDAATKTPCTPQTNFVIASVSKQFTAMAILLLVDRGKLSLDETLCDCFPGFP